MHITKISNAEKIWICGRKIKPQLSAFKHSQKKKNLTRTKRGDIFGAYTCPQVNSTASALSLSPSGFCKVKSRIPSHWEWSTTCRQRTRYSEDEIKEWYKWAPHSFNSNKPFSAGVFLKIWNVRQKVTPCCVKNTGRYTRLVGGRSLLRIKTIKQKVKKLLNFLFAGGSSRTVQQGSSTRRRSLRCTHSFCPLAMHRFAFWWSGIVGNGDIW